MNSIAAKQYRKIVTSTSGSFASLACYLLPHCARRSCESPSFAYVSSPSPEALHGAEELRLTQPSTLMRLVR